MKQVNYVPEVIFTKKIRGGNPGAEIELTLIFCWILGSLRQPSKYFVPTIYGNILTLYALRDVGSN